MSHCSTSVERTVHHDKQLWFSCKLSYYGMGLSDKVKWHLLKIFLTAWHFIQGTQTVLVATTMVVIKHVGILVWSNIRRASSIMLLNWFASFLVSKEIIEVEFGCIDWHRESGDCQSDRL